MSHVFHRNLAAELPVAVAGEGAYIIDADGRRYLNAAGNAAASSLGHAHPRILAAIREQAGKLEFAHSGTFTTPVMEELADTLVAGAPGDLDRVIFVNDGSEAIEAALKLARQYFLEIGQPQRRRFIARRMSYHGNTLAALATGGNALRQEPYRPLLFEAASHIAPCYPYREKRSDETDEAYGLRAANALEEELQRLGPDTVAAFVVEPVVGATIGAQPAVEGYFRRIREICDRHGVLLVADEVMCGMGRCGTMWALEAEGIAPDIGVIAKALSAGYQPLGAVVVSRRIVDAVRAGSGALQHGHTYMGHALACAAALEVQKVMREEGLLANVQAMGARLQAALDERLGNHAHVGEVRGRGLLRAVELVTDRATKAAFDPALGLNGRIKRVAMTRGLVVYPMGGTVDGRAGDHIVLAPPFIVDAAQVDFIADALGDAIDEALPR